MMRHVDDRTKVYFIDLLATLWPQAAMVLRQLAPRVYKIRASDCDPQPGDTCTWVGPTPENLTLDAPVAPVMGECDGVVGERAPNMGGTCTTNVDRSWGAALCSNAANERCPTGKQRTDPVYHGSYLSDVREVLDVIPQAVNGCPFNGELYAPERCLALTGFDAPAELVAVVCHDGGDLSLYANVGRRRRIIETLTARGYRYAELDTTDGAAVFGGVFLSLESMAKHLREGLATDEELKLEVFVAHGSKWNGFYTLDNRLHLRRVGVLGAYWQVPDIDRPQNCPELWDLTQHVLTSGKFVSAGVPNNEPTYRGGQ